MKRIISVVLIILLLAPFLSSCKHKSEYTKYSYQFYGAFDTYFQIIAYTKTKDEFDGFMKTLEAGFLELNKLYDIYHDYEGINNIKTINDNAGISPVAVSDKIIDLLLFCKDSNEKISSSVNITFGSVLKVWHQYREDANADLNNAKLPSIEELKSAEKFTDINKLKIDTQNKTVFLEDKYISLDVGAVAKGYATEVVAKEMEKAGLTSAIISSGGNVRAIGKPQDGRKSWTVGIQDPNQNALVPDTKTLDNVYIDNQSVVTSGDYQRYYVVDEKRIHHIIDPKTLFPANHYRAATVVSKDSGLADFLSTTLFILPFEESYALANSLDGVECLWVLPDDTIKTTDGMKKLLEKK